MLNKIKEFATREETKEVAKQVLVSAATLIAVGAIVRLANYGIDTAIDAVFNNEVPTDDLELS